MHGTSYGSRAKVVLVVLRAAKEFFDCYWLPVFLTIEKSLCTKYFHIFSGTICQRNWMVVFSHFTVWIVDNIFGVEWRWINWLCEREVMNPKNIEMNYRY